MHARDAMLLLTALAVLGAGARVGWHFAREPYRSWQKDRALGEARERVATGDFRGALLAFRRATELSPGDIETWREVAEYLARNGSGDLVARQNLVRLAPEDTALRIALVTDALNLGDTLEARAHLDELERRASDEVAFHRLATALALMLGRKADLERHLQAILQAAPGDDAARFNLAALHLWGLDEAAAVTGRAELAALLARPVWRVRAALELLKAAAATRDPAEADRVVAEVLRALDPAGAEAGLAKREVNEPPGWRALLTTLQRAAEPTPNEVASLANWRASMGDAEVAGAWIDSLPPAVATDPAVRSTRAALLAETADVWRLGEELERGAWGPVRREPLTLALAARLQGRGGARVRSDGTWADAVAAANKDLASLRVLARLAGLWRESSWTETALWPVFENYPRERWAAEALRAQLAVRRETETLWRFYSTWAKRVTDEASVQATWLTLGSLLDRLGPDADAAAQRLRDGGNDDLGVALAVVAVDWRRGRGEAAQAGLAALSADQAEQPRARFWRAVVAVQAGDWTAEETLAGIDPSGWLEAETRLYTATRARIREARRAEAASARLAARAAEAAKTEAEAKPVTEPEAEAEPETPASDAVATP